MLLESIAYIRKTKGIASESFEDETVIINMNEGSYFNIKGSANEIWDYLKMDSSISNLNNYLKSVFSDVNSNEVETFINQLYNYGLIEKMNATQPERHNFDVENKKLFQTPEIELFTDMQELMLLDPVHDVDSVEGWPVKKK
jgi:hypothetical protein